MGDVDQFCGCRHYGDGTGTECAAHEELRNERDALEAQLKTVTRKALLEAAEAYQRDLDTHAGWMNPLDTPKWLRTRADERCVNELSE